MKIKYLIVLVFLAVLAGGSFLSADEIKLKSGRVIEGEIVGETESTVKINLGYGVVGFSRSRIAEIIRSSDEDKEQLEKKLEGQRQKAIKSAKDNEKWYAKEEKRQDLLSKQRNRQHDIKLKREQILRKRKEQIEKMRKKREEGIQAIQSGETQIETNAPPPPPLPGMEPQQLPPETESNPAVPKVEPTQLDQPKPDDSESDSEPSSSSRRSRRFRER